MSVLKHRARLSFALALLVASAAALAPRAEAALESSSCGGPGGQLCKETEACAGIFWGRVCTTTYDYWSLQAE